MLEQLMQKRKELLQELEVLETEIKDEIIKKLSYKVGDILESTNGTRGVITRIHISLYSDNYSPTVYWKKIKVNGDLYTYESEVLMNNNIKNLRKYE